MSEENMTEDPLKFLIDLSGYTLIKDKRKHQMVYFALLSVGFVFIVAAIMDGFLTGNKLKPFLLGSILHLGSDAVFLTMIIYGHDINKYKYIIFENCCVFDSAGTKIKTEILNEIKIVKAYCLIPLILSTITALSFLPFVGDEETFIFQIILVNKWFPIKIMRFFVNIVIVPYFFVSGWILGNSIPITAYISFHLKFQVKLLDRHFQKLEESIDEENEEERQRKIQKCLSNFVKNHLKVKNLQRKLLRRQDFYMIMLTTPMILAVVVLVYFIKTEVSPPSNFRMYLGLTTAVVTFSVHCIQGQLLYDESSKLHEKLYACSWPDWNMSNKKQLLIILPAIEKPMEVTCFGLINLDHPYMVFVGRTVYSLLALAMNFI